MKLRTYFLFVTLCLTLAVQAAKVDTINTQSKSMNKEIKAVVITPESYTKGMQFPVVYLLSGYSDTYWGWIKNVPELKNMVDYYNIIIVCPDGGFSSWYLDSPVDSSYRYETYMVGELVPWIDKNYKTIKDRSGRGITGLSMGGHGALYLAFRHQDIFGVAGSQSGGVDIRPFPNNWDMAKRLGKYSEYPKNWEKNTVINMIHLLTPNSLDLIIDCGTGDFFYEVNVNLHKKLLERRIPHDFISRPGKHNWDYWRNSIKYQLLYISNYFSNSNKQ
jgi:S-formylglutathione hydrolase FrmB